MATGSQDPSRRSKHRRSSIDDSGESSKRRKHRHKHDTDVADERESVPFRHVASSRVDSDVEEGEIIEEGDDPTMEIHNVHAEVGDRSSLSKENNVNDSEDNLVKNGKVLVGEDMTDGSRTCNESVSLHKSSYGISSNGDIGLVILKENYSVSRESESPVKSRRERSNNDKSFDSKTHSKSLSTRDEDRDTHGRYHEDVQSTRRSHSMERGRERSKSLSISEKVSSMKMTHEKDGPRSKDAKKTNNSLEDERMAVDNWDSRHGYRDGMRDNDRERSSSYIRHRYMDSHQSRESRDGDREKSRKKDQYGRDMGSSQKREKMEDHDGESRKETSSRDRERQTERKRYRESERERGKKSDREREERELERERDRRKDRELERVRDSGRNRSRDRESYGDRESRRNRSIDRESKRNRSRDRERDIDDDRFSKNRNYQKKDPDGYEDRRMYKDSRSSRDDGTDYKNSGDKDNENRSRRYEEEQEEYQERVELQLVDQEEDDVDRIKEESRRRTLAIIEKFKMQQQQNLHNPQLENEDKEHVGQVSHQVVATSVALETLAVSNEEETGTVVGDPSFIVSKFPPQNGVSASEKTSGEGGLGFGTPKSETSGDMFCDDIFGDSPAGIRKTGKGDGLAIQRDGLYDNWDDAEGYYSFRLGEILDGRYEVAAAHGKGVFSTVVRAKDLKAGLGDPEEVAIKIIRNNEHMHKAGKEELVILKKLVGADPEDRRHCVRFLSSFKYRNHLCLVFESLSMNLREVLKKFGRNIGLRLTAVRTYSKQLFIALKHLRNCGVLHSDIKPDNMLVNEAKNVLKLCDFGNAMFAGKNEITPYLVSRFYRAPEIILGMPYDHPLDMWSVGCCIFELYSGKVLFPGATNNDMLRLHMELKGLFPKKMLRKGAFTEQHFDQDLNFLAIEEDPVTKKTMRRLITSIKPKDISAIVTSSPGADPKMLANFKDLLEKIFILDPDKRLTVSQALSHPFITGK